jgi:hypothetical protein
MNLNSDTYPYFDDAATLAMGAAFDLACLSLPRFTRNGKERELIARRIIEAAKHGELDPIRLCSRALVGYCIDDLSIFTDSVGRPPPVCAVVARVA